VWACDDGAKGAQRRAVAISTPLAASARIAHRARAGARRPMRTLARKNIFSCKAQPECFY
jgi:hypothetical protein